MPDPQPMQKRAYHIDGGAKMMYETDANAAVQRHPDEWAWEPFSTSERDAYRKRVVEQHKEAVKAATVAGQQPPPPPVLTPDVEPSEAKQAEIKDDEKARAEAAKLVQEADEKERKQREIDDKLAAARALLKSPPPEVDLNERRPTPAPDRRPPGRPSNATLAERAAADDRRKFGMSSPDAEAAEQKQRTDLSAASKASATDNVKK